MHSNRESFRAVASQNFSFSLCHFLRSCYTYRKPLGLKIFLKQWKKGMIGNFSKKSTHLGCDNLKGLCMFLAVAKIKVRIILENTPKGLIGSGWAGFRQSTVGPENARILLSGLPPRHATFTLIVYTVP